MNHLIEVVLAVVGGWILLLELRFKSSQKKVAKLEQEAKDAKIKSDLRLLSDDKLDSILAKDLSANESEH